MKKDIKTSDVKTLCFYTSNAGDRIWVGECKAGYFYGGHYLVMFTTNLKNCFRFAPSFSTKDEAVKVASLSVERDAAIPSWLHLDKALTHASFSASKGVMKNSEFPFSL